MIDRRVVGRVWRQDNITRRRSQLVNRQDYTGSGSPVANAILAMYIDGMCTGRKLSDGR